MAPVGLWCFALMLSTPVVLAVDEQLQVCPSSIYVELAEGETEVTVSVSITNKGLEPAYVSVWVNDTFNNPKDAAWRNGTLPLPPHYLYDDNDTEVAAISPASTEVDLFPETLQSGEEEQIVPIEWRHITLTLPDNLTLPSKDEQSQLLKKYANSTLLHKALKSCSFKGSATDPSWKRYIECSSLQQGDTDECTVRATAGADRRKVKLQIAKGCKRNHVFQKVKKYAELFGSVDIRADDVMFLQQERRRLGDSTDDATIMAISPRESPSYDESWPSEWPFDLESYHYADPYTWTNATYEWNRLAEYPIAASPAIMIIDTYARLDHPDLVKNYVLNTGEILGEPDVDDDGDGVVDNLYGLDGNLMNQGDPSASTSEDHGTSVATVIAARPSNGIGTAGFAPNLRILPCGAGENTLSMAATQTCMEWALQNVKRFGIRIINHSYRGSAWNQDEHDYFQQLGDMGIIHTVASGNEELNLTAGSGPFPPLLYLAKDRVYSIIGTPRLSQDPKPSASGYSEHWTYFYFPGRLPISQKDENSIAIGDGTSYSSPAIASVIGQMLTVSPMLDVFDVLWIFENSIVPLESVKAKCKFGGYPDVGRSIRAAGGLWAHVAANRDQQFALLPGDTRTVDITVRVDQGPDDPDDATERNGYVVIYGFDDSKVSQVYKLGEIPIRAVRKDSSGSAAL